MRRPVSHLLAFVFFLTANMALSQDGTVYPGDDPPTTSHTTEIANNTSACLASGNPSYCNGALPTLQTNSGNQTGCPNGSPCAQTTIIDAIPEHISSIKINRLMNKGQSWGGKIICEYQPWFSNTGSYNGHQYVGYDENTSTATVSNQDTKMINRGCNINLVDFYGNYLSSHPFELGSTNNVYNDLYGRTNLPLKFAVMEDQGSFDANKSGYCGDKTLTNSQTISCIEGAIEGDMDYIYSNYIFPHPSVMWTDGGTNVIAYFGACDTSIFPALTCDKNNRPDDWDNIWTAVSTYVNSAPHNYNMKFIFEFGSYGYPGISAGTYAWPQPYGDPDNNTDAFQDNPASQFYWCDPNMLNCPGGYLDNFYAQSVTPWQSGQVVVGLLYSGFDDSIPSWSTGRVIAQQCGQVLLASANEPTTGGFWGTGTNQIPYMMMATWNDYEEATEQESGVDNCYTAVKPSLESDGHTIQWTLSKNNRYAQTYTIHHYALWTALHNSDAMTLQKQLKNNVTSFDLATLTNLTSGTEYDVYVEMIGQPSMQNEMSSSIQYTPK